MADVYARPGRSSNFERAVIVAVRPVWMMQMSGDEVIRVVSVRNRIVAAARSVAVARVVPAAVVAWRAIGSIPRAHADLVFIDVISVREV
jgi:hypothetical protein